jgi:ribosome biogenesis GTPase
VINDYGWSDRLQNEFAPFAERGFTPARVIMQQRGGYGLVSEDGELLAELSGRFKREAGPGDYPAAGDWAAITARPEERAATIHALLSRTSAFIRKASGPGGGSQVVAANADLVLLTASLNANLNARRLERYLATAWESGAAPAVVLTKADLCEDVAALVEEVKAIALDVPVHAVSALTGDGMDALAALLVPGQTAVLLGSSGVGKSTLLNALAGEMLMDTGEIRERDDRGRHTTTYRELFCLPSGALLLDTPGMRELGLWEAESGLTAAFADIEMLAHQCRFTDCRHGNEPGCAVRTALTAGDLTEERWQSFQKLRRELAELEIRKAAAPKILTRKTRLQRTQQSRARTKFRPE